MIVNVKNIKAIFINLKTTFQKAFDQTPSDWQKVAMKVPSHKQAERLQLAWPFLPKMRKWIGDKAVKPWKPSTIRLSTMTLKPQLKLTQRYRRRSNPGLAQQAQAAGQSAAELPSDIVFALLSQGFTNLCYDGQPFFDIDHLVNGVSVSTKAPRSCQRQPRLRRKPVMARLVQPCGPSRMRRCVVESPSDHSGCATGTGKMKPIS
ncbi:Mu-like prophage major head subunit gpT family protein [Serratia ureilytica]